MTFRLCYINIPDMKLSNDSYNLFEKLDALDIEYKVIHDVMTIDNSVYKFFKLPEGTAISDSKNTILSQLKIIHRVQLF